MHIRAPCQCAHREARPWPRTQQLATEIFEKITSEELRCVLIEALGEQPLPPLQYVDDLWLHALVLGQPVKPFVSPAPLLHTR